MGHPAVDAVFANDLRRPFFRPGIVHRNERQTPTTRGSARSGLRRRQQYATGWTAMCTRGHHGISLPRNLLVHMAVPLVLPASCLPA